MSRISSLDPGYQSGDLSVFPEAIDDFTTLYEAKNNAIATLTQTLTYNGKYIIVADASSFPHQGLLRIGPPPGQRGESELIYYGKRSGTIFRDLIRGFAGSIQNFWPAGSFASNAVLAEHHNALKDALLNIESFTGVSVFPASGSLNSLITALETRFLAPKALFSAYPPSGPPGTVVRFQNFSDGNAIRFLWNFGDSTTSIEKSPFHTYPEVGNYTVQLNIITANGAEGIATKNNYITISESERVPFFYARPITKPAIAPATFEFVDQTDGDIVQRFWIFDDGSLPVEVDDPDTHAITHTYLKSGIYNPTLLIITSDQGLKRVFLNNEVTVL